MPPIQPYSKSKLELQSNLSEILPVNCEFVRDSVRNLCDKLKLKCLKFGFKCKKESCIQRRKFGFFEFSSSLLLEYGRLFIYIYCRLFRLFFY